MKKFIAFVLLIATLAFTCVSCGKLSNAEITVVTPDGAPALAVAKLMNDENSLNTKSVTYKVVSATTITSYALNKSAEAIILPLNAATKVAGDNYKLAGVVTHGNLYVVSSGDISSLTDLAGKRVGAIGQGQVPDLTMKAILTANDISYDVYDSAATMDASTVYFDYYSAGTQLIPLLKKGDITIGVLPEPAVTNLQINAPSYSVKLNVQELYDASAKVYPQAVLLVKNELIEKEKGLVENLIQAVSNGAEWAENNPQAAVDSIGAHLEEGVVASFNANTNADTIRRCNVYFEKASAAKSSVLNYISRIQGIEEKAISAVTDSFFMD